MAENGLLFQPCVSAPEVGIKQADLHRRGHGLTTHHYSFITSFRALHRQPLRLSSIPKRTSFSLKNRSFSEKQHTSVAKSSSATEEELESPDGSRNTRPRVAASDESGRLRRRQIVGGLSVAAGLVGSVLRAADPSRALLQTGAEKEEKCAGVNAAENLKSRVSAFTLSNGMRWIVLERRNAPVVSCHTYTDVGAADEADGLTGIAHLLEHLAFKGTKLLGTRDAEAEASVLDQLDESFYALCEAERQGGNIAGLLARFDELKNRAAKFSIPNEYGALISREGGIGLNAETSQDATEYHVSLPANKLELWMALESGRFIAPVFRELYTEKEVVKEERRLRVDNTPYGRFTEAFTQVAFKGLPYGRPVIGYPEDFEGIGRREVTEFFQQHYTPAALTCAIVGDVDPSEVERLAAQYFGGWTDIASSTLGNPVSTKWRSAEGWDVIPKVEVASALHLRSQVQPLYMEGYYRPPSWSSDDPTISVLDELLSGGRRSRFYKNLILAGKALTVESSDTYPGSKQSCLLLIYGTPTLGGSTKKLADSLHQELEDLAERKVKEDELAPIKKASKVGLLEAFGSNPAMAKLLARYEATTGSWANLLQEMDEIEKVSADDILQVASFLFNQKNVVVGYAGNF